MSLYSSDRVGPQAVQDYVPHLLAITKSVEADTLLLKNDPGEFID